jgi:hypothetical protein
VVKIFVVSGVLKNFSRDDLKKAIRIMGKGRKFNFC